MYYIGLDVHKKTISYCINEVSGQVHQEGKIGATRCDAMRTGQVGKDSSSATDDRDGGNDLHRMDLRVLRKNCVSA